MVEKLGERYKIGENEAADDGLMESVTIFCPHDHAALDISFVIGEEVMEHLGELADEFPTETLDEAELAKWREAQSYGGNVNIEINGDFRNVNDYRDLDGMMVGGVLIHVLWGGYGNDCGCILLDGAVQKLAVGGQEHWMDCLRWKRGLGPHNPNWNPRDGGDVNRDGKADVHDLMAVLAKYGTDDSDADLDASGSVDVRDLLATLRGIAAGPTPHPDPAGIAPLPSP